MENNGYKQPHQNGWNEWAHRVLGDLERIEKKQDDFREEVVDMKVELATLKAKAGIWGGISGAIGGAVVTGIVAIILKGLFT